MSKRIAKFEKVSLEQFKKDWEETFSSSPMMNGLNIEEIYENIKLPERSTAGSAGYDFKAPAYFSLMPGSVIKVPTGIKCKITNGYDLKLYPRSSLGFKYMLMLMNTTAIIDSDYYNNPNNEGHIFIKLINMGDKLLIVEDGDGFAQGIFEEYHLTEDDNAMSARIGGIGSTGK